MTKEKMLEEWCDRIISLNVTNQDIKSRIKIDASKQVKTMIKTKGWNNLKDFLKEKAPHMLESDMVGPHNLGLFYLDAKNKMWSIDRKFKRRF